MADWRDGGLVLSLRRCDRKLYDWGALGPALKLERALEAAITAQLKRCGTADLV